MDYKELRKREMCNATKQGCSKPPITQKVKIKLLYPESRVPEKAHPTDACFDAWAVSKEKLAPNVYRYGLGFAVELPEGTRLDLRPRSSIYKTGMVLSNSIGTGDFGFTGEYQAVFFHCIKELPVYEVGDRILQIHIERVTTVNFEIVDELGESERGSNGFGSTGNR